MLTTLLQKRVKNKKTHKVKENALGFTIKANHRGHREKVAFNRPPQIGTSSTSIITKTKALGARLDLLQDLLTLNCIPESLVELLAASSCSTTSPNQRQGHPVLVTCQDARPTGALLVLIKQ